MKNSRFEQVMASRKKHYGCGLKPSPGVLPIIPEMKESKEASPEKIFAEIEKALGKFSLNPPKKISGSGLKSFY